MTVRALLRSLAIGTAVAVSTVAASADGMNRDRRAPVVVEGPYNWSGFYIGVHAGAANIDVDHSIVGSPFWATGTGGSGIFNQNVDGWTWGGHIGYNFASGPWVFGVEVTYDLPSSSTVVSPFFPVTDRWRAEVSSLTTVTGRLGYAFDRTLLYAKGGYAGADVESTVTDISTNVAGLCGPAVTGRGCFGGGSSWRNGWTVGAGIEHALARNLILGVEYNFIDLGSERSVNQTSPAAGSILLDQTVDTQIQTITARLSVKLN